MRHETEKNSKLKHYYHILTISAASYFCVQLLFHRFQSVNSAFRKRGAQTTELLIRIDGSEHLGETDRTHGEQGKKVST